MNSNANEIWRLVEEKRELFFELSDKVWETPETNYLEERSSKAHVDVLEQQGFRLSTNVGGLPTAIMGEAGQGGPVIAILGEYDALPGLSQVSGVAHPEPVIAGGNGHGCGHNLLGAGAMQAATAVKDYLEAHKLQGRVRYYGCPAEEGGSGKGYMVRGGAFKDVDIAISWHPSSFVGVNAPISLACAEMLFTFQGRASHAAASPHLGRSALDAIELMNVGVNYMREHVPSHARIHYAITDSGGHAPNIVQAKATVRYVVRGKDIPEMRALVERVKKVADGAALMTETTVTYLPLTVEANLIGNDPLELLMQQEIEALGLPEFDDADEKFARKIQNTLSQNDIETSFARFGLPIRLDVALCDVIAPMNGGEGKFIGSTDVGNVSWVVPTVQMRGATHAIGTPDHSWQIVAQGKTPVAHKGMEHAAKVMASTAVRLLRDPSLIEDAKGDFSRRMKGIPYEDPIPAQARPPIPGVQ